MFEKIKKAVRHNTGQAVAIIVIGAVALWMFGCESTVKSLIDPSVKITRAKLGVEKDRIVAGLAAEIGRLELAINATSEGYEVRVADLDKLDAARAKVAEVGMIVASGGTVNPIGLAATFMAIFGIGAVADNRKKDGLITEIKKLN